MSAQYGEGFKQPLDFMTGKPIPGAPRVGIPSTNRPDYPRTGTSGSGYVIIEDEKEDKGGI